MFDLIAALLAWLYEFVNGSYFGAIALLTLLVLFISTPLTLQGTKSMLKMQLLQPEIKAIQNKYGPDQREEMNKELMAYYQDNNINPVGGCVPMLFQIPVFLVLYRVILGLTRRATDIGYQFGTVVGETSVDDAGSLWVSETPALFNPAYLNTDSEMYQDLSKSNEMNSIGFDLSRAASNVLDEGVFEAWPYLLLVLVVGATGFLQHRMIRARNTGAAANPTQEMIMKIMPFFLPVFAFTLPAAIVIYFLVSNVYRIGQQYYITRSMYHGEESLGAQLRQVREDDQKSGGSKSGGSKSTGAKASPAKTNGKGGGQQKAGAKRNASTKTSTKSKKSSSGSKRTSAPGRNTSGKQGSARTQVQPKARKKKKR